MSSSGCVEYRNDIEQYIAERNVVSKEEIFEVFLNGRDTNDLQLELNILVDKSKLAFDKYNGLSCINFDGINYKYVRK